MAVVEVRDLRRTYGRFEALKGISFEIEPGEIVGLLGPNGAGKSTTMKILTGYLAPTSGSATVCGHNVLLDPTAVRTELGYLPESSPVYREMDVTAFLQFIGRVRGLGMSERARAIDKVSEQCGIRQILTQRIDSLSRGLRQRVGLAQALLNSPRLLILDEPTSGLDPNQIVEIRKVIREVGRTRTVILSTHILSEVQVTCDRIIIIHQGRIVADDNTEAITARGTGRVIRLGLGEGKVKTTKESLLGELGALDGVNKVISIPPVEEAFRFEIHTADDVRANLFDWARHRGHILVELSTERTNLEDIFRRLTEGAGT
ncbi:MAG: ATP-binding cassette domain-containing protein [Proteobacteria bacterium]|jgi:ABC-2 type transport system ATP-binding protein|nr:ATP-binding cassette domain-containing protein [Pseudomonadota bacterium]